MGNFGSTYNGIKISTDVIDTHLQQHHVEDNHVWVLPLRQLEPGQPISGFENPKSRLTQVQAEQVPHIGLILNKENGFFFR